MRVSEVIDGLAIKKQSEEDPEVVGISQDSRFVQEGYLFVALVGKTFDGRAFISDAMDKGAVGVMSSGPPPPGFEGVWLSTPAAIFIKFIWLSVSGREFPLPQGSGL